MATAPPPSAPTAETVDNAVPSGAAPGNVETGRSPGRLSKSMDESFDKFFTEEKLAPEDKAAPEKTPQETPPPPGLAPAPVKKSLPDLDKQYETIKKPEKPEKTEPAPQEKEPPIKGGAKELRSAYETTKAELAKREATIAELQKQIETVRTGKTAEDSKAWETEKQRYAERIKALEGEIAATDFTKSREFQEEFQVPINKTYQTYTTKVTQLKIMTDEGEMRPATKEDLDNVLSLPLDQAIEASEKFGRAAPLIMQWRERLEELVARKTGEVTRRREQGGEFITEQAKAQQEVIRGFKEAYDNRWKTQTEKLPQLYAPDGSDKEGDSILEQDRGLVDFAFEPDPDSKPQDVATARAEVGLRAMAFRRAMHRLNTAKQEIETLKEKLAAYENSQPGSGIGSNGATRKQPHKHVWDGIDDIPGI